MVPFEFFIAGIMLISLTCYALLGGADFGGGVWVLLAAGPRGRVQRKLIAQTIAPIWEANHVWLILIIVLLFVCFPMAFATISIALHIPLTLMLIGIVLRGSAFVFRNYGIQSVQAKHVWSWIFGLSSIMTPLMLGVTLGAVASGTIRVDLASGQVQTDFISAWLAPFPLVLGIFVLVIFTFLAAVYLTMDTDDPALQDDFRRRALGAGVAVILLAWTTIFVARSGAPLLYQGLTGEWWSLPIAGATTLAAGGVLWALWQRRFKLARSLVVVEVILIIWDWGLSQFPYLVPPDLTIANTAAPESVLRPVFITLIAGTVILIPSLVYLYKIFFQGQSGFHLEEQQTGVAK